MSSLYDKLISGEEITITDMNNKPLKLTAENERVFYKVTMEFESGIKQPLYLDSESLIKYLSRYE